MSSVYPGKIDSFDLVSDLDSSTMAKAKEYKSLIESGKFNEAATYLANNPDLDRCGINANIINNITDAIVNIETEVDHVKTGLSSVDEDLKATKKTVSELNNLMVYDNKDVTIGNIPSKGTTRIKRKLFIVNSAVKDEVIGELYPSMTTDHNCNVIRLDAWAFKTSNMLYNNDVSSVIKVDNQGRVSVKQDGLMNIRVLVEYYVS